MGEHSISVRIMRVVVSQHWILDTSALQLVAVKIDQKYSGLSSVHPSIDVHWKKGTYTSEKESRKQNQSSQSIGYLDRMNESEQGKCCM
ncbi:hypothetical protein GUJ93_ZPchr0009g903 [Zizania palustris]|uniref:Uncharacterized protein n=1 Tax=Zizania palustris TaxID=103762 RepID=A0A8J5R3L8_ZIZPA|nr:hypothetical protein GUJ93_ZPchr0009g903 [Zizania palustris]